MEPQELTNEKTDRKNNVYSRFMLFYLSIDLIINYLLYLCLHK